MGEEPEPETGSNDDDEPRDDPSTSPRDTDDAAASRDGRDESVDANSDAADSPTDGAETDEARDGALDADGPADPPVVGPAAPDAESEASEPLDEAVPEVEEPGDVGDPAARRPETAEADAEADESVDDEFGAAAETTSEYGPLPAHQTDAETGSSSNASIADADPAEYAHIDDPEYEYDDDIGEGLLGEGPEEDEEMPLADHIEEMVRRLGAVFLVAGVVLLLVFPASDRLINFLWNAHIPGAASPTSPRRPRLYGPLELILTELKVAGLAGFVVGLPVFVYQTYRFMRPGLYPKERRYYLASVPTSLVLALVGVAFAHLIVLPAIFAYFTSYTANADIVVAFGLRETFNLILLLMGYMAVVFQIPLFMMLAVMMGLVTRRWMTDKRLLFWGGFLGLAFLVSPDPTGMAPIIVAATMISLFEGTLLLLKWTGR